MKTSIPEYVKILIEMQNLRKRLPEYQITYLDWYIDHLTYSGDLVYPLDKKTRYTDNEDISE